MKRDYIDFQERSAPLAYLITIRCYGTWLHGDERGSMNRPDKNRYGEPGVPVNMSLQKSDRKQSQPEFLLAPKHRTAVERAVKEVCEVRSYMLYAVNIRSNHAHMVVAGKGAPEPMMTAFKAYSTRRMRETGLISNERKVWSRHGSTKYLWTEDQIDEAVAYVRYEQGM